MWIVVIAWMYVAVMMAVAEAFSPQGSILGGVITLLLYGVAPLALVMYLLNTPMRRQRLREQERQAQMAGNAMAGNAAGPDPTSEAPAPVDPDASRLPASDAIAPEGKEP